VIILKQTDRRKIHPSYYIIHGFEVTNKALQNWKIFLKALSKQLQKLTIKTKRLWEFKFFSFVKVND